MELGIVIESKLGAERFKELGLLAESYGFSTVWVQNYARSPDAFMTAMPLAMASSTIRVGIAVISPYEVHPLKIANAVLTLNEQAGGRASVVVGAGGEWAGVLDVKPGKRITTAREALEIITQACGDEVVNFEGEIYTARAFSSRWTTQARPRIYAGANGPKMLRMAAGVADGVMMSDVQPEMFDWALPSLKEALAETGRSTGDDFPLNNFLSWHVKEDAEASRWEARRELIIRAFLEPQWIEPFLGADDVKTVRANLWPFLKAFRDRTGDIEGVDPKIVDTLVEALTLSGGLEDIDRHVERLERYATAGFTELAIGIQDDPEFAIRTIGEQVLPRVR